MQSKKIRVLVLIGFAFSGAAALMYEVTWTRALSLLMGSTIYALSTMLATFMAGLALGGYIGGRLADKNKNLLMLFGLFELGIGIFGLITIPLINSLPPLYFAVYKAFHLSPTAYFLFQFFLCAGIMLVPTTLMGATFPVVSKVITDKFDEMGRGVGSAYTVNTFGAIFGSLATGFILIPIVGIRAATIIAAFLNLAVAGTMLVLSKARIKRLAAVILIAVIIVSIIAALISKEDAFLLTFYQANRYTDLTMFNAEFNKYKSLFDRDYREGKVKAWRDGQGFLIVQIGGKNEGTTGIDVVNTLLLAYLPIASHRSPQSFLTIGLGAGITVKAAKPYIRDNYLVEINEGVLDALNQLGPPGLLDGVDVAVNDARNYLLLTDRKFDIISSEPSYPTEHATGNLFTKEFYEIASSRLNKGGIFSQWLPYYQISDDDMTMMIRTFGAVFKYVYLWKIGESMDRILVGSNELFAFDADAIKERVKALYVNPITSLPFDFSVSRTPEQVSEIIRTEKSMPENTDDRPILEFHAARNFLTGVSDRE